MTSNDGSNAALKWIAGIISVGVLGVLVWFALPLLPQLATFVGDTLRAFLP